jgi:hypothetical protein
MAFGPPYPLPGPYKNDEGRTVERTACVGINVQCCSGLRNHIKIRKRGNERRIVPMNERIDKVAVG